MTMTFEFGPRASLDHFIGRPVVGVDKGPGKSGHWTITLEGGIVIGNKDNKVDAPTPESLEGRSFCRVILSETDTRLQFGNSTPEGVVNETWVTLSPTKYTIAGLEGQKEEFYPQMPEELASVLPPDPSSERIVDGPRKATKGAEEAENGSDDSD